MEIRLLTCPQVNWQDYLTFVKKTLGFSPSKILDNKKIDLDNQRAFILSLESIFSDKLLFMIDFMFLIKGTLSQIHLLKRYNNFEVQWVECGGNEILAIAKSDLGGWVSLAREGSKDNDFEIRKISNCIYLVLQGTDLFSEYTKVELEDGTFNLKRR